MQKTNILCSQDFYEEHLSTINNIHFTAREIDVIACILSARKTSKIAYFLSINTRTIETHVRNIMLKLECNTREGIIDFIEKSDRVHFLRTYYSLLQIEAIFEKNLRNISKLNQDKSLHCFLTSGKNKAPLIAHLKSHLNMVGITVSKAARKKEADYLIVVLPKDLAEEEIPFFFDSVPQSSKKILFLLQKRKNDKENPKEFRDFEIVDFSKHQNYYFSFFSILKKILLIDSFDKIISEFKDQYRKIYTEPKLLKVTSNEKSSEKPASYPIKSKTLVTILCGIGLFGSVFLAFYWDLSKKTYSFRSDLIIPTESALLQRPDLIAQIDEKLKGRGEIQTVALAGAGGAGKTTLARQYARQKKTHSLWEVNAETRENLNASFEKLAQVLAQTENDKKTLRGIQEIKKPTEKEEQIIQFVKERLKFISNWILIFDNVETFTDIQKHFPHNSETWGMGKIILTTRDHNIENNKHINHAISIGELTPDQKLNLFTKIMTNEDARSFSVSQTEEAKRFLEKIPPFPLDVSIAAYYLKATNVAYSAYLENLDHFDKEFEDIQENILKEIGEYTKVRYRIITLSLQKILNEQKIFEDLLLLASLLDSQNIPIELLNHLHGDVLVSHFIINLKKYSLITSEFSGSLSLNSAISIHRSTQAISLSYLIQKLGLNENKELIKSISKKLVNYIDETVKKENLDKMKYLISHCEAFLAHKNLLTQKIEGLIKGELGIIYYFYGDSIKAKQLFEDSLLKLNNLYEDDPTRISMFIGYLGNVFRNRGDYNKAKIFLENSITTYEEHYPKDNFKHAYFLVYLGIVEIWLGKYDTAKTLFEKGSTIQKKHFPKNENYRAWIFGQLGILDRELGNYEKAKDMLETSLTIFKKDRGPDHFDVAWALENLGVVYTKLGDYEKARDTLEQSLKIYAKILPDPIGPSWILAHCESGYIPKNYGNVKKLFNQLLKRYNVCFHDYYIYVAWITRQLGNIYIELGNHEKAKVLLEQSLSIYQKNYGEDHIDTARTLNDLGQAHFIAGDLKTSEDFIIKALRILEKNNHPDQYKCLENLSKLYIKKSILEMNKGKKRLCKDCRDQALLYLQQALEVLRTCFPADSPHILRIEKKIMELSNSIILRGN